VNSWQLAIHSCYCITFAIFAKDRFEMTRTLVVALMIVIVTVAVAFLIMAFGSRTTAASWVEYFAMFLNICMYASPLGVVALVIRTRSVEFMPLPLSIASLSCSLAWFFYGLEIRVYGCVIPNGLGVVFGIAQVLIYWRIYKLEKLAAKEMKKEPIGADSGAEPGMISEPGGSICI
jgi:solute carrier family 50 (sugar transporter)